MINEFVSGPSKLSNIFGHLRESFSQLEYGNSDIEDELKDVFGTYNDSPDAFDTFVQNLLFYFDELCEIGIFKYDPEDQRKISICLGDEEIATQMFKKLYNKLNKQRFAIHNKYIKQGIY